MADTAGISADAATTDPQRRALRRHQALATGLLAVMTAVYVVAVAVFPEGAVWAGFVEAGAEAALIGGIADWFAVTALFRHPLGVPVPHTALIPRNKDRIGRRIGDFVAENFVEPHLLRERLRAMDPADRMGAWLADPANARAVATRTADLLPPALAALKDDRLRRRVRLALSRELRRADVGPLAGRLAASVPDHELSLLLNRLLAFARDYVDNNHDRIEAMVAERNAWWVPRAVDRQMARGIAAGVSALLDDLGRPGTEAREQTAAVLADLRERLRTDPDLHANLRVFKNRLARHPALQERLAGAWDAALDAVEGAATGPDSRLQAVMTEALRAFGQRLRDDPELRATVNEALEDAVAAYLVPWRREVATYMAGVVRRWEGETVADRVELAAGRDLQFIRINGTVVGALVGATLHGLVLLAGG